MTTQTPQQLGVCSWSMLPQSADDMARIMSELDLKKLQLGLVPHRDDAGIVDGVPEALEKAARTGEPTRFFLHPHINVGRFFVAN